MGVADSIPGVSGGTIALILGIYERIIKAITQLKLSQVTNISKSVFQRDTKKLSNQFRSLELYFLLSLGFGIISAVLLVLNLVDYLLEAYPVLVYGFFFGLIGISVLLIGRSLNIDSGNKILAGFTGVLISLSVTGIAVSAFGHSLPVLFVSGLLAVSAKVLPGISGALILLILGQYSYMTSALSDFTQVVLEIPRQGFTNASTESVLPIIVFMLGSLTGLFTIAHIVKRFLEKNRELTMIFLVGLMAGSLRAPIEQVSQAQNEGLSNIFPEFVAIALLGGLTMYVLDYISGVEY